MNIIDAMQKQLEQAIDAASKNDDRELADTVRDIGRRVIFQLAGLIRISRLYDSENDVFKIPTQECSDTLGHLVGLLGAIHIIFVEDQVYINDIRLRMNDREQAAVDTLIAEFNRHHSGGISFHDDLAPALIKQLTAILAGPPLHPQRPREALSEKVAEFSDVSFMSVHRFKIGGEPTEQEVAYEDAIKRGETAVRDALRNLCARRLPNPLPIRRAVIDLVTSLKRDGSEGMAAPMVLRSGTIGERHLLSVSSLAILLGEALSLGDSALSDLGVAAMMHDVGYTQGAFYTGHEAAGAWLLVRQRGFHEAKIRRILGVLNHHSPFKPKVVKSDNPLAARPPSLFARILHIVDDYDVLTSPRPGFPPPKSPTAALECMWAVRGTAYDPDILALFVQKMGKYPPGTLLELSDGRWAISVSGGRDKERFEWPVVRIVRDSDEAARDATIELDLFPFRRRIGAPTVIDPAKAGEKSTRAIDSAFHKSSAS